MIHSLIPYLKKQDCRLVDIRTVLKNSELLYLYQEEKLQITVGHLELGHCLKNAFIIGGLKMKQSPNCSFNFHMSVSALLRDKLLK